MAVDGLWGGGSRRSLESFQRAVGLDPTGSWNRQTHLKETFAEPYTSSDFVIAAEAAIQCYQELPGFTLAGE